MAPLSSRDVNVGRNKPVNYAKTNITSLTKDENFASTPSPQTPSSTPRTANRTAPSRLPRLQTTTSRKATTTMLRPTTRPTGHTNVARARGANTDSIQASTNFSRPLSASGASRDSTVVGTSSGDDSEVVPPTDGNAQCSDRFVTRRLSSNHLSASYVGANLHVDREADEWLREASSVPLPLSKGPGLPTNPAQSVLDIKDATAADAELQHRRNSSTDTNESMTRPTEFPRLAEKLNNLKHLSSAKTQTAFRNILVEAQLEEAKPVDSGGSVLDAETKKNVADALATLEGRNGAPYNPDMNVTTLEHKLAEIQSAFRRLSTSDEFEQNAMTAQNYLATTRKPGGRLFRARYVQPMCKKDDDNNSRTLNRRKAGAVAPGGVKQSRYRALMSKFSNSTPSNSLNTPHSSQNDEYDRVGKAESLSIGYPSIVAINHDNHDNIFKIPATGGVSTPTFGSLDRQKMPGSVKRAHKAALRDLSVLHEDEREVVFEEGLNGKLSTAGQRSDRSPSTTGTAPGKVRTNVERASTGITNKHQSQHSKMKMRTGFHKIGDIFSTRKNDQAERFPVIRATRPTTSKANVTTSGLRSKLPVPKRAQEKSPALQVSQLLELARKLQAKATAECDRDEVQAGHYNDMAEVRSSMLFLQE